jgi:hypothetical protein
MVLKAAFPGDRLTGGDATGSQPQLAATCTRKVKDVCVTKQRQVLKCRMPSRTYASCKQDIAGGRRNVFATKATTCTDLRDNACVLAGTETTSTAGPCVADPNEWRWTGAWCPWVPRTDWTKFDATIGPNLNCPAPMLGLSGNRRQVIETLDRMTPVSGGTHADVGLRWGLRTLSPSADWPAFFGLTKPPVKWAGEETKMMILITDGENTQAIDYPGYWGCKGYLNPGCAGSPEQPELDLRTTAWCNYIKKEKKIDLFVIAVNFTNAAAVSLLQRCAGEPKQGVSRFYRIDAAEMKNVMKLIAGQVVKLRLTG